MRELRRAEVVVFQKWMVLSEVPPPEARSEEFQGHHARACSQQRGQFELGNVGSSKMTDFDGGGMVGLAHLGRVGHTAIPNIDDVVVSSTREELRSKKDQLALDGARESSLTPCPPPLSPPATSGLHSNPHTSPRWPLICATQCSATLTSLFQISPVLHPLERTAPLQLNAGTLER